MMRTLREDRRNKGVAIPRFVRALNKAGYSIEVSEYKRCEELPGRGIDHVREYMLTYAYQVLNSTRVQNSVQGKHTAHAMTVIADRRIQGDLDYFAMSSALTNQGVQITEAEYRTHEQGMTKHVPFEVIALCAVILNLDPSELFNG